MLRKRARLQKKGLPPPSCVLKVSHSRTGLVLIVAHLRSLHVWSAWKRTHSRPRVISAELERTEKEWKKKLACRAYIKPKKYQERQKASDLTIWKHLWNEHRNHVIQYCAFGEWFCPCMDTACLCCSLQNVLCIALKFQKKNKILIFAPKFREFKHNVVDKVPKARTKKNE